MPSITHNTTKFQKRAKRVRAKMHGTAEKPRLSVFRSNKYIFLQAIDDSAGKTLASASDLVARKAKAAKHTKTESATAAAQAIAAKLQKANITALIFDRGAYKYHGRVKAVAEELRAQGMKV
jgi:large subunit ribosomal protein L18